MFHHYVTEVMILQRKLFVFGCLFILVSISVLFLKFFISQSWQRLLLYENTSGQYGGTRVPYFYGSRGPMVARGMTYYVSEIFKLQPFIGLRIRFKMKDLGFRTDVSAKCSNIYIHVSMSCPRRYATLGHYIDLI